MMTVLLAALLAMAPYKSEDAWQDFRWRNVNLADMCREGRSGFVVGDIVYECEGVSDCVGDRKCSWHWEVRGRRLAPDEPRPRRRNPPPSEYRGAK